MIYNSFYMIRALILSLLFILSTTLAAAAADPKPDLPKLWPLSPTTALKGQTVWYSAKVSDNDVLANCIVWIDNKTTQSMTVKKDVVMASLTFDTAGTHTLRVVCTDSDGYVVEGKDMAVKVTTPSPHVKVGNRIKMGCPAVVYPNHPCTAVYYYGGDGKRHAFSTERVYKSWFKNFDNLVIVSEAIMSDIPLGKNVTFRPGERLVKFSTNTVYSVSFAGLLRPIANAEIARSLYGQDWVSLIEGVDDVFFGNYRIGYTIQSTNDFNWKAAESETNSIDKTF